MKTEFGGRRCKGGRFNQGGFSMYNPDCAILGGDPFSDIFRGLYDPKCFWRLTDPDYCLAVMQALTTAVAGPLTIPSRQCRRFFSATGSGG